MAEKWFEVTW